MLLNSNPICGGEHSEETSEDHTFSNEYTAPPQAGSAVGQRSNHDTGPPKLVYALDEADMGTLGGYVGLGFSNPSSNGTGPSFGSRMMTASSESNWPSQLRLTMTTYNCLSAAEASVDAPPMEGSESAVEHRLSEPPLYQDLRPQQLSFRSTPLGREASSVCAEMVDVSDSPLSSVQQRLTRKTSVIAPIQSMTADTDESPAVSPVELDWTRRHGVSWTNYNA